MALLTVCMFSFAQTFVSTTPANKNVILEEYTGKSCVFCPDGHRRAQELVAANPGRAFAINIHQGGYASGTPNYTTQFGDALANQTGLQGYPSGTINRHVFTGTTTALNRGDWAKYADTIMSKPSPVNIAAQSTIDWATRVLTVVVEVYYTGNAANDTNKLHVALLQNEVLGPQTGGTTYNPTMMVGSLYRHMHMLRHLLTGQWGVDITTTTTGSFFTQTFTYTIPEHLNNVNIKIENIEVLAFVSEGRQEILTGCESTLTPIIPNILSRVDEVKLIEYTTCDGQTGAYATISNVGLDSITSVQLTYTVAGGTPQILDWNTRTIQSMSSDTIHLPTLTVTTNVNQIVAVQISGINGSPYTASNANLTINKKVANGGGYMSLKLVTDQYADETTFKIFREDGSIILSGGPFTQLAAPGTTTRWFAFEPDQIGCYRLEVYDEYGDGINSSSYGLGYFQLIKYDNTIIINDNGKFGKMARYMIDVDMVSGVEENVAVNNVNVYPNPTDGITNIAVNLVNDASVNVTVYNVYGQLVQVINDSKLSQGANNLTLNASNFASGIYLVKVTIDGETITKKITVR